MHNHKTLSAILCVLIFLCGIAPAMEQPNIPKNLWEQRPEGVAVAMTLVTETGKSGNSNLVMIYIQNTATTKKYFNSGGIDQGVKLFYVNGSGAHVPLRESDDNPRGNLSKVPPLMIQPGETISRAIRLTPIEAELTKLYPFSCRFFISDDERVPFLKIETIPKMLNKGS